MSVQEGDADRVPTDGEQVHSDAAAMRSDVERVRSDAAAMRARMLRDLPPDGPWDVKLRAGGQIEVEFIAQVVQLIHARAAPQLCSPTTRIALNALAKAGMLAADDAVLLVRADHVWRTVQGMLRITVGRNARDELPDASARALLRAAGTALQLPGPIDLAELRATLDALARQVRAAFVRTIGEIRP